MLVFLCCGRICQLQPRSHSGWSLSAEDGHASPSPDVRPSISNSLTDFTLCLRGACAQGLVLLLLLLITCKLVWLDVAACTLFELAQPFERVPVQISTEALVQSSIAERCACTFSSSGVTPVFANSCSCSSAPEGAERSCFYKTLKYVIGVFLNWCAASTGLEHTGGCQAVHAWPCCLTAVRQRAARSEAQQLLSTNSHTAMRCIACTPPWTSSASPQPVQPRLACVQIIF